MNTAKRLTLPILAATLALSTSASSQAEVKDNKDLYELAGPDSAFVRIVNLRDTKLTASFSGETLSAEGLCSVSKTQPILAGLHEIQGDNWTWKHELMRGKIYTVLVDVDNVSQISAPLDRNPMKANFEVFNLQTETELDVATAAGAQTVFDAIPVMTRSSRTLNPLRVELVLNNNAQELAIDPIAFARGKTTSLMVCNTNNSIVSTHTTE